MTNMKKNGTRSREDKTNTVFFRKPDAVLLILFSAAAVCLLTASAYRGADSMRRPQLEILIGNALYGVYDLQEDRVIRIRETNVCEIRDGEVRMTEADCPDQLCVRTKEITEKGGSIVCLPNHIILRVTDAEPVGQGVDSIAE